MKHSLLTITSLLSLITIAFSLSPDGTAISKTIKLPQPRMSGPLSLEEALANRRSIRSFSPESLTYNQLSQLAWAAQGITEQKMGFRTAPSAGAIYPVKLYFATENGLFVYNPQDHALVQTIDEDIRAELSMAALGQAAVARAECDIIITGSVKKVAAKYGQKARTFTILEAGHVAQNILLQVVALDLAAVPIGAFDVNSVGRLCRLPSELEPFYIISIGHSASTASISN